jgi:Transglycosylase SLT domain
MSYGSSLIIALLASQTIAAAAIAGERTSLREPAAVVVSGQRNSGQHGTKVAPPLDRVAIAVDGAESSHGEDRGMWRPDPSGPQGPMQVSEAAATDVGGGDRFDLTQNRAIGRAYLAQLYGRYKNWPDTIAAYNWGLGKMDAWIKAGRPPDKLLTGVAVYLRRVLHESGLCEGSGTTLMRQPSGRMASAHWPSPAIGNQYAGPEVAGEPVVLAPDSVINAACSAPDGWAGAAGFGAGPSRFFKKLDQAMQLALQRARWGG